MRLSILSHPFRKRIRLFQRTIQVPGPSLEKGCVILCGTVRKLNKVSILLTHFYWEHFFIGVDRLLPIMIG